MSAIPTRRNITIHFSDDELDLLTEFNKYCKTSYETKSGWIKRRIYSELTEHKNSVEPGSLPHPMPLSLSLNHTLILSLTLTLSFSLTLTLTLTW